ncbi:MAG: glycine cleavage system aminomethyltransferase GcvT [Gammaproteobacteria bacterium]|nr:MAG: glycine cleavage system aminomethyltransferase GcvT [Gammaproteobacteria bacterium]
MAKQTPLYSAHARCNAKFVDFGGWALPIHYGSQIREHEAVRQQAGMFDVSHMTVIDLHGERVFDFLRYLLANDISRIVQGQAMYSCMLNDKGGIIDDLIVYFMDDQWVRMVVNAATHDKDLQWIEKQSVPFDVSVQERQDLAMIAVQGPNARAAVHALLDTESRTRVEQLKTFFCTELSGDRFIARTGYTGEDGYECMLPSGQAESFWDQLVGQGVQPCGLGARDTLRLEAGMALYGSDMDENIQPAEANLSWTVSLDDARDFIGKSALSSAPQSRLIGLILDGRGVLRNHLPLFQADRRVGEITSGGFSPTLGKSIALARVLKEALQAPLEVELRGKRLPVRVVAPVFVRNGQPCIKDLQNI